MKILLFIGLLAAFGACRAHNEPAVNVEAVGNHNEPISIFILGATDNPGPREFPGANPTLLDAWKITVPNATWNRRTIIHERRNDQKNWERQIITIWSRDEPVSAEALEATMNGIALREGDILWIPPRVY